MGKKKRIIFAKADKRLYTILVKVLVLEQGKLFMANGNLTLKEFFELSREEQNKRYSELSDRDKFGARQGDWQSSKTEIPCNTCVNRLGKNNACRAFPNGIPGEHIRKMIKDQPYSCGNGYKFNLKETIDE